MNYSDTTERPKATTKKKQINERVKKEISILFACVCSNKLKRNIAVHKYDICFTNILHFMNSFKIFFANEVFIRHYKDKNH